jgi:hypothetical protein
MACQDKIHKMTLEEEEEDRHDQQEDRLRWLREKSRHRHQATEPRFGFN